MTSMYIFFVCLSFILLLPVRIDSHLCLIEPRQRGDMDISQGGSGICFRHGSPCGGQNASSGPYPKLVAGKQVVITWQQNFNHYTVGYPGYMDIAIAEYGTDTWQLLAFTPDDYVYAQDHQQNYSAIVNIPKKECIHCVIRARYNSHKPGEDTFYQCADVTIEDASILRYESSRPHLPLMSDDKKYKSAVRKLNKLHSLQNNHIPQPIPNVNMSMRGFSYSPMDKTVNFVNVTLDGHVITFGQFNFGLNFKVSTNKKYGFSNPMYIYDKDSTIPAMEPYLLDSIMTVNSFNNMVGILHAGSMDEPSAMYVEFDTHQGTWIYSSLISKYDGYPYNGIVFNENNGFYNTFSLQGNNSHGYEFVVGLLYLVDGTFPCIYKELIRTGPEPLYVNYQWMVMDQKGQRLFVLMGNENTPDKLNARIYRFDLKSNKLDKMVELDVDNYTFMSIHYFEKEGKLYTISPGTWSERSSPKWTLIEVDPVTGKVTPIRQIIDRNYFRAWYGGSVFSGIDQSTGVMYHVLKLKDADANVIVTVDIPNQKVNYSEMVNLSHVYNLALTKYLV
ncbi:hypothetical protein FSP39_021257 [Pinctada imbricata]|uniref:Chitin-binding type-4 domain-containing protein n=1 Tax=Pinctada imbricata TaxID=66713 RepID=A0AA88YFX7_PINIB|nr:hypothetical protein FSP39_021257 [Pinctada imbricata]